MLEPSSEAAGCAAARGRAFDDLLRDSGVDPLRRLRLDTVQLNLGLRCNQACHHCHLAAGPGRRETMSDAVASRVAELLDALDGPVRVDLTGGAPELCARFRWIVERATAGGHAVIDRCNLTVLEDPALADLGAFLAAHRVQIVASLPCYTAENTDAQRGAGAFERSIAGLARLNALGYGRPGTGLELVVVYNPGGPQLPGVAAQLEEAYRARLRDDYGLRFNRLQTMVNAPLGRFARALERDDAREAYEALLAGSFNPRTVGDLMCRSLVSIRWDGALFDCDFNLAADLPVRGADGRPLTVFEVDALDALVDRDIATAGHCLGCTAGAGSSCFGAIDGGGGGCVAPPAGR